MQTTYRTSSKWPQHASHIAYIWVCMALSSAMPFAHAINGYFMPAYGPKSLAVGGTGVAMHQDRLTAAINPAGMALVEPGLDANLMLFHPQRSALLDCTGIGQCDHAVADRSNRELFEVPGFGWRDQSVYKFGAIYKHDDRVTLRAGWNRGTSLVPDQEALLAPLVPGIMRDHLGISASYRLSGGQEISFAYMHAFGTTVEDRQSEFFGVPAKAWAATDSLDFGFSLDF